MGFLLILYGRSEWKLLLVGCSVLGSLSKTFMASVQSAKHEVRTGRVQMCFCLCLKVD